MIYATFDSSGGYIMENAQIFSFLSREEAIAWLLSGYDPTYWDHGSAVISGGRYGDCWIKTLNEPTVRMFSPFGEGEVYVSRPGTHPGFGYWATPSVEVLVMKEIRELVVEDQ